ncbi:Blc2 family [Trinorchestia longiramus]|nr:Blc2 family [Trinorchestia longiramus]
MNYRGPRDMVEGGFQNGASEDLCCASVTRTPTSCNDAQRSPPFISTKATLITEIPESKNGSDKDLSASNGDGCSGHSLEYVDEDIRDDDENGERSGERKKLVKSPCSSGRRSSSPWFTKPRRTNDLLFDVRDSKVDLVGFHQDLNQRTSKLENEHPLGLVSSNFSPNEIDNAACKGTNHNTLQTKLIGCPRISVEKTLGSVDNALAPTLAYEADRAARTLDDLNLETKAKFTDSRHRKISIPLLKPPSSSLEPPNARERSVSPARRKFSNVSDAVSRKISTTIGWRSRGTEEVVPQAKYLCSQYIRCRLRRAGLLHKKIGLQRIRSVINLQWGVEACEVFPRLLCLGQELERSHPQLYSSVVRQLSISLKSDKVVRHVILAISSHLLTADITWAKIISLYAMSAALAADCVKQGHPEFVSSVVEGVGLAIEQHSGHWIVSQGGWTGVLVWSHPPAFELTPLQLLLMIGTAGVTIAALIGGVISLLDHLMS